MQIWPCSCALESGDAVRDAGSRQRGSAGGISANQGPKIKRQKLELKIIWPFGPRPNRIWTETGLAHFLGPTVSVRSGRPTVGLWTCLLSIRRKR